MSTVHSKQQQRIDNVLFYLDKIISKLESLQLNNTRNKEINLFANSTISDLSILKRLIETSNLKLAIEIVSKVNELYKSDPYLSDVILHFTNVKRNYSGCPAYLKLPV
ncbi:hypothetical protein M0M57_08900 [Flavobacterium azooxidireducens]|uniref:Uncharacterized protein n=1 Tax=Flavobacterium azooxidireducens TaxID=1871076 RepID=A0ABY4KAC2_9FLAO|nr:hypothetical protein [Flavobacterium azooxidireducens]UPQ77750.1 hypothetical protein M0M57_08900 [Flavobacterium azooxidireducens]